MSIPWLMNCGHLNCGWCIPCVKTLGEENIRLRDAVGDLLAAIDKVHGKRSDHFFTDTAIQCVLCDAVEKAK